MSEPDGIGLLEPIDAAEWVATPAEPTVPQLEPDPIIATDLKKAPVDKSVYTDPTVQEPTFSATAPTPPTIGSEKPVEAPVRLRG